MVKSVHNHITDHSAQPEDRLPPLVASSELPEGGLMSTFDQGLILPVTTTTKDNIGPLNLRESLYRPHF